MAAVCCDTSFLFSLYGHDAHTPKAIRFVSQLGRVVTLSALNEFELANALRFAEWRGLFDPGKAAVYLADFQADLASGLLNVALCNLAAVIDEAKRLSASHTAAGGHRSFDILHVAVALQLKAREFLTFDDNQKRLALREGLKVGAMKF